MIIKIIFLAVVGIAFVAGCEEEGQTDTRRVRLIINENAQLKKDLGSCGEEVEKQKVLLEQCEQAKKAVAEQYSKDVSDLFKAVLGNVLDESRALSEENKRLKAEIAELRRELGMHKAD